MTRSKERERIARNYENKIIENNPSAESYDYMNAVIYGAEWADRTMIDKACEWLESVNLDYYQIREGMFSRELVIDFRKAMEE